MQQDDPFGTDRMRDRLAILDAMSIVIERRQELMDVVASAADGEAADATSALISGSVSCKHLLS
jgi:hypothetical protein